MNWFETHAPQARVATSTGSQPSLRRAQVAAAWSIAASLLSGRPEAALAVLPTGTGKGAVLTAVPLLVPPRGPVLVAAPNRIIRDQLAESFRTYDVLKSTGVLPPDTPGPLVRVVRHRLETPDEWVATTEGVDVVVGTLGVLSPAYTDVAEPPADLFGMVLVDEAHHTPAPTWGALLRATRSQPKVLLTATPIRLDGLEIPAELVYSYPISDALRDGVLAPVNFIPVTPGPDEDRDDALARAAVGRIREAVHSAASSKIIARTGSKLDAERLVATYSTHGARLATVTSETTERQFNAVLNDLREDRLDGLISIGVLGEGFNFPQLKVAVYHKKHKSLPSTLQFIGRISRQHPGLGPAELIAVPDEDLTKETRDLYESDPDWSRLFAGIADAAVFEERTRRSFLTQLKGEKPPPEPLSAAALRVPKEALVLRVSEAEYESANLAKEVVRVAGGEVIFDRWTPQKDMRVLVTSRTDRPDFVSGDSLDHESYNLHVILKDPKDFLVYVYTSSDSRTRKLLELFGFDSAVPVSASWLGRLLNALKVESYFSVGMRSSRQAGGALASYRMLAGRSIGGAVSANEAVTYSAGHLILRASDPTQTDAGSTTIGMSIRRGKLWNPGRADLVGYKNWCFRLGRLGRGVAAGNGNAPGLSLRLPSELEEFPDRPVAALIDSRLISDGIRLLAPSMQGSVDLAVLEIIPTRTNPKSLTLAGFAGGLQILDLVVDTNGQIGAGPGDVGATVRLPGATENIPIIDLLYEYPPVVYFGDGSSVIGGVLNAAPDSLPGLDPSSLSAANWAGVDTRHESLPGRNGLLNVQEFAANRLRAPGRFIINDDGAGEIADLISIEIPPELRHLLLASANHTLGERAELLTGSLNLIEVTLSHCKFAGSSTPRRNLKDLDEVVGQATRSSRWMISPKVFWATLASRVGNRASVVYGDGDFADELLSRLAKNPPDTSFRVQIVQPGLRISGLNGWREGEALLGFCGHDLRQVGASFDIVGSID